MRATRAYITGFGTTGLLIASAFLMLFVMSAFVAFNGFPGQDVQDPIGTLLVPQRQTAVTVPVHPVRASARSAERSGATQHRRVAARRAHTPAATTAPVAQRSPSKAPATTQAPAAGGGSGDSQPTSSPSLPATPQLPSDTPSLPDPSLPQIPGVSVPQVQAPSSSPPTLDTSSVTNLIGGQ